MIPFKNIREHSDIKAFLVLAEKEMTPAQMKKREEIAQSMSDADFKKRYGKDWKSVKMATATKQAMKTEAHDDQYEEEYIDHWCAKHVYHDVFGEGVVVEGEHAIPDEEGVIDWYTVEFPHGKETVFTEDIEVMHERMHGHMMKKKKKVMEDAEELEELSRKTLTSYVNKAMSGKSPPQKSWVGRIQGLGRASEKLRKPKEPSTTKEEVEELEELKKSTLGSYVKKASTALGDAAFQGGRAFAKGDLATSDYKAQKEKNRSRGIYRAATKLAKEEVEDVEEALVGNQHKIDMNKNNKIDAHDFHLLRKIKKARAK